MYLDPAEVDVDLGTPCPAADLEGFHRPGRGQLHPVVAACAEQPGTAQCRDEVVGDQLVPGRQRGWRTPSSRPREAMIALHARRLRGQALGGRSCDGRVLRSSRYRCRVDGHVRTPDRIAYRHGVLLDGGHVPARRQSMGVEVDVQGCLIFPSHLGPSRHGWPRRRSRCGSRCRSGIHHRGAGRRRRPGRPRGTRRRRRGVVDRPRPIAAVHRRPLLPRLQVVDSRRHVVSAWCPGRCAAPSECLCRSALGRFR